MTRPVYSFRPNLKNPEHQKAWEKFQSVPEGQKNQYLVQAILEKENQKWMEEIILAEDIPDQMMDFLSQMENM